MAVLTTVFEPTPDDQQKFISNFRNRHDSRWQAGAGPVSERNGNGDGLVNRQDLADYPTLQALSGGQSSWYDLNLDGLTDMADLGIIQIA